MVENQCDIQLKTKHGERAREIACRYDQSECVDYLDWAGSVHNILSEVAVTLSIYIQSRQGLIAVNLVLVVHRLLIRLIKYILFALSEAKQDFQQCIRVMRDMLADPEKNQGRLSRDEKVSQRLSRA